MKKSVIVSAVKFVATSAISAAAGVATGYAMNNGLNIAAQKNCAVEQKGIFGRRYYTNLNGDKISKKVAADRKIILEGDEGINFLINGTGIMTGCTGVGAALGTSKVVDFSISLVEKKIATKNSVKDTEVDDEEVEVIDEEVDEIPVEEVIEEDSNDPTVEIDVIPTEPTKMDEPKEEVKQTSTKGKSK